MAGKSAPEPEYQGSKGGAYTTEEHLKAQQEQASAIDGKPLHDELVDDDGVSGKHDVKDTPST